MYVEGCRGKQLEKTGGGQKRKEALIEADHGVQQECPTCSHICKCVCVCCKKVRNNLVVRCTTHCDFCTCYLQTSPQ